MNRKLEDYVFILLMLIVFFTFGPFAFKEFKVNEKRLDNSTNYATTYSTQGEDCIPTTQLLTCLSEINDCRKQKENDCKGEVEKLSKQTSENRKEYMNSRLALLPVVVFLMCFEIYAKNKKLKIAAGLFAILIQIATLLLT